MSGPVDPSVEVSGARTLGAVAWAWALEDRVDGAVLPADFQPLVYRYSLDIPPPPDPEADGQGSEPNPWASVEVPLLAGLPILVEPERGRAPELAVDPVALLRWAAGEPVDPEDLVSARGGRFAAYTSAHVLLLVGATEGGVDAGQGSSAWEEGGPWCRWDLALPGLTLYRSLGPGCGGWEPLAPPGSRTEFQGIPVTAP